MTESNKDEKDEEKQGFKVRDRRRFEADGTARAEAEAPASGASESASQPVQEPPGPSGPDSPGSALPAEFSSLLLSLAGSAQSSMGIAPNPMTGQMEKNLLQAKHAIDLLGVLQEKTKGNLTPEEGQLLQALLYDLRMRYVEAQKEPDHEKK